MKTTSRILLLIAIVAWTGRAFAGGGDAGGGPKSLVFDKKTKEFTIHDFKLKRRLMENGNYEKVPAVVIRYQKLELIREHVSNKRNEKELIEYEAWRSYRKKIVLTAGDVPEEMINALRERPWWFFAKKREYREMALQLFNIEIKEDDHHKILTLKSRGGTEEDTE